MNAIQLHEILETDVYLPAVCYRHKLIGRGLTISLVWYANDDYAGFIGRDLERGAFHIRATMEQVLSFNWTRNYWGYVRRYSGDWQDISEGVSYLYHLVDLEWFTDEQRLVLGITE